MLLLYTYLRPKRKSVMHVSYEEYNKRCRLFQVLKTDEKRWRREKRKEFQKIRSISA